ncbi:hypothetical protein VTI28DRAFT_9226 [Corynascus sepedonium]
MVCKGCATWIVRRLSFECSASSFCYEGEGKRRKLDGRVVSRSNIPCMVFQRRILISIFFHFPSISNCRVQECVHLNHVVGRDDLVCPGRFDLCKWDIRSEVDKT